MPRSAEERDAAIDALLDKAELHDLAMRYARAIDRRDQELLRSVYHDDAIDHHGTVFNDLATRFVEQQPEIMARFEVTAHFIANTSYRLDGDRAEGELYFIAYHRTLEDEPKHMIVTGRYLDHYERRAGAWKIAHRALVWDSFITLDVADADTQALASLGEVGKGADDFSYATLKLLARGR